MGHFEIVIYDGQLVTLSALIDFRIPLVFSQAMLRKNDTTSVRMKTRTKKNNSKAKSISSMDMMTCSAFGFFAGPTICYSTGMIIARFVGAALILVDIGNVSF